MKCDECSLLAQLVEHYLDKVGVSSSSLLETTMDQWSVVGGQLVRKNLFFLHLATDN